LPRKDSDSDEKRETSKDFKEQVSLMEQLLASFHSLGSGGVFSRVFGHSPHLSLEILSHKGEITLRVVTSGAERATLEKLIVGLYPDALIEEQPEINIFENRATIRGGDIVTKKSYFEPIKSYQKLESDPINSVFSALAKLGLQESAMVQIAICPKADTWQSKALKYEKKLAKSHTGVFAGLFGALLHGVSDKEEHKDSGDHETEREGIKEKAKKIGYTASIRIVVTGQTSVSTESIVDNIAAAYAQYGSPGYNSLRLVRPKSFENFLACVLRRSTPIFGLNILSIEELASLYHFPHSKYNRTAEIKWQNFKIVKAPVNVATEGLLLGTNTYQGVTREIYMKNEDRFRHFYVIGQTGTGKTTLLQVMARQDIRANRGLAVMDPHGDFANDLMPFIPKSRSDDIIYFDPADLSRPLGINLLEATGDDEKQMVAQDALNIMIKLYGSEIFGPRIQDYFRNGALTLMDYPGGCALTDILRLFTDDEFQKERRRTIKDPVVRGWWDHTFSKMGEREKGEMIPFFAAKFGGFITNKLMRNIIGQTKSSFDIYEVMQSQKILLINLSKGILGDVNSNLLGLIIVSKIQMAAMRRQSVAKEDRKDFFLYIDEFQNYVTDSIESILSEARKYRLGLAVAHQYLGQLQKSDALTKSNVNLKDAIFGNVGSIVSYKIGPEDAEFLAKQFNPYFSDQDLINMDKFK
jgi:energy-coupling factor transporter ATP-binding protein EcfA2